MMTSNNEYIEYTIRIKDEKYILSENDDIHGPLLLSKDNADLKNKISLLYDTFKEKNPSTEAPEIAVRAKMVWQF